jgi:hypothetical protein
MKQGLTMQKSQKNQPFSKEDLQDFTESMEEFKIMLASEMSVENLEEDEKEDLESLQELIAGIESLIERYEDLTKGELIELGMQMMCFIAATEDYAEEAEWDIDSDDWDEEALFDEDEDEHEDDEHEDDEHEDDEHEDDKDLKILQQILGKKKK